MKKKSLSILTLLLAPLLLLSAQAFAAINASQTLAIQTGGTERARITSSGLIINNTASGANLTIGDGADTTTSTQNAIIRSAGFAGLVLNGDYTNLTGEPGGTYVAFALDGNRPSLAGNSLHYIGMTNLNGQNPSGVSTTDAIGNSLIMGTQVTQNLQLATNNAVNFTMLGSTGNIGIGRTNPGYPLDVSGTLRATTFIGDGSALTNLTGDNLGNHTATQNLGIGSNSLVFGNTVDDKIYLFSNTYGIGIESSTLTNWSGSQFRWRTGGTSVSAGTQRMLLSTTGLTVTGFISSTGVIDAGGAIYGYAGDSVTAPGYTWSGDTNTGMYWVGADQIGISTGGVQQLLIRTTGLTISGSVLVNNVGDTAGAPSYSWSGDTNTGLYWVGADQIGISTGGVQQLLVKSTGLTVSGSVLANNVGDTAAAPSYSWSGDTNTGIYWPVADTVAFSTGGTERVRFNASGISTTGSIYLNTGGNIIADSADTNYASSLGLYSGAGSSSGGYIVAYGVDHATASGRVTYFAVSDTAGFLAHRFYTRPVSGSTSTVFSLYQGGDGILAGDMTAASYKTTGDISLQNGGNIYADDADSTYDGGLYLYGGSNLTNGASLALFGMSAVSNAGQAVYRAYTTNPGMNGTQHLFISRNGLTDTVIMRLYAGGSMYIAGGINSGGDIDVTGGLIANSLVINSMTSSRGNNVVCYTTASGALTQTNNAAGCTVTSDATLKKDVTSFAPSLEKLLALRPVTFHWKDPKDDKETQYGFIAQEVNKVMPELTYAPTKDNKYWSMSTNALIPYLVKGLQEAMTIVKGNSTDIAALKAENAALKQRLAAIEAKLAKP